MNAITKPLAFLFGMFYWLLFGAQANADNALFNQKLTGMQLAAFDDLDEEDEADGEYEYIQDEEEDEYLEGEEEDDRLSENFPEDSEGDEEEDYDEPYEDDEQMAPDDIEDYDYDEEDLV